MDIPGIFAVLKTHAQSLGIFGAVLTHEPKGMPLSKLTCCITYSNITPASRSSGLASTSAKLTVIVRIMRNMMTEPLDNADPEIGHAVNLLMTDYMNDFDLGGKARNIDVRGAEGEAISAPAGYISLDSKWFRVVDIRLPIIVNDAWTESP